MANAGEKLRLCVRRGPGRALGLLLALGCGAAPAPSVSLPSRAASRPALNAKPVLPAAPAVSVGEVAEHLDRAFDATQAGKLEEARALQDEAARLLEQATGKKLEVGVPDDYAMGARSYWSREGEWLLSVTEAALRLRRRGEWYPRFRKTMSLPIDFGHVVGDSFVSWFPRQGAAYLGTIDVSPSERFGDWRPSSFQLAGFPYSFAPGIDGTFVFGEKRSSEPGPPRFALSVLSMQTGDVLRRAEGPPGGSPLEWIMVAPTGGHALATFRDRVSLVNVRTGSVLLDEPIRDGNTSHQPFSPDERYAVWSVGKAEQQRITIYDLQTREQRHFGPWDCGPRQGVAWATAAGLVAFGSHRAQVCVLDLATGSLRRLGGRGTGWARPLRFTRNGKVIRVAGVSSTQLNVLTGRVEAPNAEERALDLADDEASPPVCKYPAPSPDGALLTSRVGVVPPVCAADTGVAVPGSPRPIRSYGLRLWPSPGLAVQGDLRRWSWRPDVAASSAPDRERAEFGPACLGDAVPWVDPHGSFGLMPLNQSGTELSFIDCDSGKRSASFMVPSPPQAIVDERHLVLYSEKGGSRVWDIPEHRTLVEMGEARIRPRHAAALSSDRRYLFLTDQVVSIPDGAVVSKRISAWQTIFVGQRALVASTERHLDVYRAPSFELVGQIYFTHDMAAAIAVKRASDGGSVQALEVLGPPDTWDTALECGVGRIGVPFRICRERLQQTGLLAALLAGAEK